MRNGFDSLPLLEADLACPNDPTSNSTKRNGKRDRTDDTALKNQNALTVDLETLFMKSCRVTLPGLDDQQAGVNLCHNQGFRNIPKALAKVRFRIT